MAGQLHALVGPSGSGKTSTLRTIAGLSQAKTGKIECDGETWFEAHELAGVMQNLSPAQRSCGFLFQQYALFPHLSAIENVLIPLQNAAHKMAEPKAIAQDRLGRMGIAELAHRFPHQLSGGQQQRVALARALARQPKLLLLDAPFSAVDAPTRQGLYKTLADLRKDLNIPIVLVTHDLHEADLITDRITVIDNGISLQTAAPQVRLQRPRNSRVAELVGISHLVHGIFNAGNLSWDGCDNTFTVADKGKISPNAEVAWVIPQDGFSIQLQIKDSVHKIEWMASASEVKRLNIEICSQMYIELDGNQIHIMPLRPINDPRRFIDRYSIASQHLRKNHPKVACVSPPANNNHGIELKTDPQSNIHQQPLYWHLPLFTNI
ncbi:ABC transporter ATP-binding protein [Polynucleobacter necessarius]|uniref:ABC transporter ATP-binding protein n=1 Tax=Polynucleobacter necessarius TaxID=576610 RepID=UPI0018D513A8|nr:ABC transporter ATP-binding protein [Polynucleobacter necessarius]